MIDVTVNSNGSALSYESTVSDSVKYEKIKFNLPVSWEGYTKTAVFRHGEIVVNVILNSESELCTGVDECYIPHEVIKAPDFTVSVFGVLGDSRVTSTQARIGVKLSGYAVGDEPSEPTPTEYEQLINLANETKQIARSVRTDADNGVFKGDPFTYADFTPEQLAALKGKDGYTPKKGVDYFTEEDIEEATENKLDKPSAPPAVGDFLKVISVNQDGTFACEWAGTDYELIEDYTAETDIEIFLRNLYPDGNSYDLNKILMDIQLSAIEDSGLTVQMYVYNPNCRLIYIGRIAKSSGHNRIIFKAEYFAKSFLITESVFAQNDSYGNKQILISAPIYGTNIKGIMTTFSIPKDSRIRIYGVRA